MASALDQHFTVGNVILSDYWREHDLVVAYYPSTADRYWSVDVIHCDAQGVPVRGELVRNHSTSPDKRDRIISHVS